MKTSTSLKTQSASTPSDEIHDDAIDISEYALITRYLLENVAEFRRLSELRKKGWQNPKGDTFFKLQRRNADEATPRMANIFYEMMKRIGNELNNKTKALTINTNHLGPHSILDTCMAPGGFLATALDCNPGSHAVAFSLPKSDGGHGVLLPKQMNIETKFLDITLLAEDMGMQDIPREHPDAGNFLPRHLEPSQLFDLVICDGQVLRTHPRASYRQKREALRLTTTQLALGVEHIRPGGTMVVLLHKVETWSTLTIIRRFHTFSSVTLFKPTTSHTKRSSFYMVATDVQSQHPEAIAAIKRWKALWKAATFGTDDEYQMLLREKEISVDELIREFGSQLIMMGREVWRVQADALAKAPFI